MKRWVPLVAVSATLAGCGAAAAPPSDGRIQVVAAENMWGSIAAQLGGDRVQVESIVHNPAADPHDYEPTAADARSLAVARLAIVNGAGYDPWASKLLSANPVDGRVVLNVADLVGVKNGGNPHLWYSPPYVHKTIGAITAAYKRLDPGHATFFDRQRTRFESRALARYSGLIAAIKKRDAGVPVGASESIFAPLAQSLGLRLITPSEFYNAISEGGEPTAGAKATADRQIAQRQMRLWVYNSQNATPDVRRLTAAARAHGIPVVTVTETLNPSGATFEQWQSRQLTAIEQALSR